MLMKDIGEEVAVLGTQPLPAAAERIRHEIPAEQLPLPILTDVFDGFLRHLAGILDEDGLLVEDEFWAAVRDCIEAHAADHPELSEAVERYDLLRPEFKHSCLNRLQLRNTLEMVDLAGPVESMLHWAGVSRPRGRRAVPARWRSAPPGSRSRGGGR